MRNRTSIVASILMLVLGVFTFLFVSGVVGVVLTVLGIIMLALHRWLTGRFAGLGEERR